MKIRSRILGELEIEREDIIAFPKGIPGFENEKGFIIIPIEENGPFYYLQSVGNPELCLLIANPFIFFPDYEIDIPDEELEVLGKGVGIKDIAVYAILNVPEDFRRTTANLLAPLIINEKSKKGFQFIPRKSDYNAKHPIFKLAQEKRSSSAVGEGL